MLLTHVTHKQLVSMVLRLTRAGMSNEKAVSLVSHAYAADPDQLEESIRSHKGKE